ncbi:neuronal acetylcholine receptor subunit beta-2-like [Battus philenor]|uniref:neuronal acetylcholine receptor subunit beta-2-like n=1 Tax=Battus philenor TaxID=42288 RepID=UPI0035CFC725
MIVFPCVLIFYIIHLTKGDDCVIDNRSPYTAWDQQLRKELIPCADKSKPPNANNTNVSARFQLKSFYFDDNLINFHANIWLHQAWNDPRLKWDPKEYDGITELVISNRNIWTPDLMQYKTTTFQEFYNIEYFIAPCTVSNTGFVTCVLRRVLESVCSVDLKDWPYDTQNCTFKFGKVTKSDLVTFVFNSTRIVSMFGAEYGPGWNIIDYSDTKYPNGMIQFDFSFILERQAEGLGAIVVVPPLVLAAITLLSMTLNVESRVRLSILCFSLLNHFFFLQEISSDIPKLGLNTPTVLIFLRSSVVITLVAIGITFVLSNLYKRTIPPHNYILILNEKVFETYGKYLIWPRWKPYKLDESNQDVNSKFASTWSDFSSLINFVSMFTIAIVYMIMFFAYIPRKPEF